MPRAALATGEVDVTKAVTRGRPASAPTPSPPLRASGLDRGRRRGHGPRLGVDRGHGHPRTCPRARAGRRDDRAATSGPTCSARPERHRPRSRTTPPPRTSAGRTGRPPTASWGGPVRSPASRGRGPRRWRATTAWWCCRATPASARPRWPPSRRCGSTPTAAWCSTGGGTRRASPRTRRSARRSAATPPPARAGCCGATSSLTPTTSPGCSPTSAPASAACGRRWPTTPTPSACACSTPCATGWERSPGRRPVLLVLDDLQWAEHSSLLPAAAPASTTRPTARCCWCSPSATATSRAWAPCTRWARSRTAPRSTGSRCPASTVPAVVELMAPGRGPARRRAGRRRGGTVAHRADRRQPVARPRDPAGARPRRSRHRARWRPAAGCPTGCTTWCAGGSARLDPETNETLAAASVVGEQFSLDVLAATLGCRVIDLRHRLDDASRAGVVRDTDDGQGLAFAHAVVRRALQDDVPRRTGRRAAPAHRPGPQRGRGAAGLGGGDRPPPPARRPTPRPRSWPIRWARTAADQARRETAFEGAVWFLSRAVDVHDRFGDPAGAGREVACELRLDLAEAHDRAGEFIARDRRHLEAAELARELDRTDLFTRAALGYGGRLPATPPHNPVARRLLDEALDRLSERDSRARALALARLAHVLHAVAPHDDRRAISDEAEAMARRLEAPVVVASVLVSRVLALDGPDDVDDHLEIGAEVIRIGEQTGDSDLVLQGARARIHPLFVVGAHDAARDLAGTVHRPGGHGPPSRPPASGGHVADHVGRARGQLRRGRAPGRRAATAARGGRPLAGGPDPLHADLRRQRWMQGRLAETRPMVAAAARPDARVADLVGAGRMGRGGGGGRRRRAGPAGRPADRRPGVGRRRLPVADRGGRDGGRRASTVGDRRWAEVAHDLLAPYSGRNMVFGYVAYLGAVDHHLGTLASVLGPARRGRDPSRGGPRAPPRDRRPPVGGAVGGLAGQRAHRAGTSGATPPAPTPCSPRRPTSPPPWGCASLPPPHPKLR